MLNRERLGSVCEKKSEIMLRLLNYLQGEKHKLSTVMVILKTVDLTDVDLIGEEVFDWLYEKGSVCIEM